MYQGPFRHVEGENLTVVTRKPKHFENSVVILEKKEDFSGMGPGTSSQRGCLTKYEIS